MVERLEQIMNKVVIQAPNRFILNKTKLRFAYKMQNDKWNWKRNIWNGRKYIEYKINWINFILVWLWSEGRIQEISVTLHSIGCSQNKCDTCFPLCLCLSILFSSHTFFLPIHFIGLNWSMGIFRNCQKVSAFNFDPKGV